MARGKAFPRIVRQRLLLCFGSVSEPVEPLALGQCEGLAHPGSGDRGPGDQVLTLLDGEIQNHRAGLGIDAQENRTGATIANLLQGRAGIAFCDGIIAFGHHCIIACLRNEIVAGGIAGDISPRPSVRAVATAAL